MYNGIEIIAEVKTLSPFGFKSEKSWEELFDIANKFGDMISIHTNPKWGGNYNLITEAKRRTNKKVLAKGFHSNYSERIKALEAGADYVLVVGELPSDNLDKILFEPVSLYQLKNIPQEVKVVWNERDLSTGKRKIESFESARRLFQGWICQASFIRNLDDIKEGANGILVGENLERFYKSLT